MAAQIEEPQAGEPINKLWEKVCELVRAMNALQNLTVVPSTAGKFTFAEGNVALELFTEECS